jgi:hypothetical protein
MRICASQRNRRCRKPALRWRKPWACLAKTQAANVLHGELFAVRLHMAHVARGTIMPAVKLTEVAAWALIIGVTPLAILEPRGTSVATQLTALANKPALLDPG